MKGTIFSSSVLTIIVIALRYVFRGRISRRLQYALWLPLMLRLLVAFPLMPSPVSVMNVVDLTRVERTAEHVRVPVRPATAYTALEYSIEKNVPVSEISDLDLNVAAFERASVPVADLLRTIWIYGAAAVGLWFIGVNTLFYHRLRRSRRPYTVPERVKCNLPVYRADGLLSPCLFGAFRPSIYLTSAAIENAETTEHVITHELCHCAHGDHVWSLVRGLCLALHWFNPLVWLAAAMSRTDCELACDQATLERLGEKSRISYGRTLLDMVSAKPGPATLLCSGTTMASEKRGMKERIDLIIKNPKNLTLPLVVTLLVVTIAVGCTFTDASHSRALRKKISEGLSSSDPMVRQAWSIIQTRVEMWEKGSQEIFGDKATKFTDAEITTLKTVDRFDDIEKDSVIEVYLLQFRMLPQDPSKLMLAGGSTIENGWLLSQESMGDPRLVARVRGGETTYLGTIYPELTGVLDATLGLMYRLESKKDSFAVATSPIEVSRVLALDDVTLSPEEAARLFTLRFLDVLREEEDLANPQYKTFFVTDYEDVSFVMYPTSGAPDEYQLSDLEVSDESWLVEPSVSYRYKGTISPIGDGDSIPPDEWVTELYQGSPTGFLMRREGNNYTFRSRYPSLQSAKSE